MNPPLIRLLMTLGAYLGKVLVGALASLLTENFLRSALIIGLEKLAKRTDNEIDDQLVSLLKGENYVKKSSSNDSTDVGS